MNSRNVDFSIFAAMPEELEFVQQVFSKCKAEIIVADKFEFTVYHYKNFKILLASTGLGTTFAASVVTLVHNHFQPKYIFFSGTAGGIKAELKIRDVIIAEKAFEAEIQGVFSILEGTPFETCLKHPLKKQSFPSIYSADPELIEIANSITSTEIAIHNGIVVSSNSFPATKELFERIKRQNPHSIDMETSAFYQIAWLLSMPAIAVRGISNQLNRDGTDDKLHESDINGSTQAAATILLKIIDSLIFKLENQKKLVLETKSEIDDEIMQLIRNLNLQPHPEGGMFSRNFQSSIAVTASEDKRYGGESRHAGTSIYYLLKRHDFSAWHSLKSDEVWHYYRGCPIKIHVITPKGEYHEHLLGDPITHPKALFQIVITADNWFAAEICDKESYCLVGCTVSPGFEFKDFVLADRKYLVSLFPQHTTIIEKLTRAA